MTVFHSRADAELAGEPAKGNCPRHDFGMGGPPVPCTCIPVTPTCSACGEHPSAVYCKKCCPHEGDFTFASLWTGFNKANATIARLERELAEAKRPKERSRMLILAARAFADEHRASPSEPVDVECSLVDWIRSELMGAACVLPRSNVVLSPHEALNEGELRVKP